MHFSAIKPCFTTSIASPDTKQTMKIPTCYNDLIEVFSKTKATQLPLHRQWDCTIDLLPNAMPSKSKVYPLSHSETQAMEEYIEEAMNSGFIRPSTSPAAAGFFFFFFCGKEGWRLAPMYWLQGTEQRHSQIPLPPSTGSCSPRTTMCSQDIHQTWSQKCLQLGLNLWRGWMEDSFPHH